MEYVRSQYRIKKPVDRWLSEQAKKNNRSKNGELNAQLEKLVALSAAKEALA